MGTGLLVVKVGFILFIKIYQFLHNKHALERFPGEHMISWIFVLVQKGSNVTKESF